MQQIHRRAAYNLDNHVDPFDQRYQITSPAPTAAPLEVSLPSSTPTSTAVSSQKALPSPCHAARVSFMTLPIFSLYKHMARLAKVPWYQAVRAFF